MAKRDPLAVGIWDGHGIRAASTYDRRRLADLDPETFLEIYTYNPRTAKQLRYIHVLSQIGADNSAGGWTAKAIRKQVKIRCGFVDGWLTRPDGSAELLVWETGKLTRDQATEVIEQMMTYIQEEVCPGIDPKLLKREADAQTKPHKQRS